MDGDKKYDVIIAGAGMAGTLAAAAAAQGGAKVLMLDRNERLEAGKKTNWGWVCGDAVAQAHLDFIKSMIGLTFKFPALDQMVEGVIAYSPDMKSKSAFEGSGYVLNRPIFEGELQEYAIKHGVEYMSKFEVEQPIIENNYVVGITGKDDKMQHREFRAKVVVDALGVATTLRRKLPENEYVEKVVHIDDLETTGRFLYEFELDHEDMAYYDPKNALIHLNQEIAPGGYGWVFPKSGNRINVGIGVQQRSLAIRNEKLNKKDNLHSLMEQYAKMLPVFKSFKPFTEGNGKNGSKGYWSVAVRHQMESLVYNGYLGAGDSMAMPNPISAGGIGPAMVSGILAGRNAAEAVKNGDFSIKGMWKYNLDYNEHYGKKTAGLEVFRIYLQSLNNDIINYGMKNFLTSKEAVDLSYGNVPELSMVSKFKMALKGASNIGAFSNLVHAVKKMKELNAIYEAYPTSPDKFLPWKAKVTAEVDSIKERFKPNPI
jgi:digeranylgeranylglycerophospholipid reductase